MPSEGHKGRASPGMLSQVSRREFLTGKLGKKT